MPSRSPLISIATTLAVLLLLYAALYFSLVSVGVEPSRVASMSPLTVEREKSPIYSRHEKLDNWLTLFFAPAHWLDRDLRRETWKTETVVGLDE